LITCRVARGSTVVVHDATRILARHRDISLFKSGGGRIKVLQNIRLAAITTNPVSPDGRMFDAETLLTAIARTVRPIPVIDVIAGKTRNLPTYHEKARDETDGDGVA
jgi:hypothetical protein